jgi:hypothetical protein
MSDLPRLIRDMPGQVSGHRIQSRNADSALAAGDQAELAEMRAALSNFPRNTASR